VSSFVNMRLRTAYFRHLSSQSLEDFQKKRPGEHLFGINDDLGSVSGMILSIVPSFLNNAFSLLVALIIMFKLRWEITLAYLCLIPLICVFRLISSTLLKEIRARVRRLREEASGVLIETIRTMPLAKLFGRELTSLRR